MNHEEKVRNKLTEVLEAQLRLDHAESAVSKAMAELGRAKGEAARTIDAVYGEGKSVVFKSCIYHASSTGDLLFDDFESAILTEKKG